MREPAAGQTISTILKHDRKVNSYKIALLTDRTTGPR